MASFFPSFVCTFLVLSVSTFAHKTGKIGVNYGRIANDLPQATQVVQLLKSQGLARAKIFDTDPNVLKSFANSGISLTVAMPNQNLKAAAASKSYTDNWVKTNILPYYPATKISAIAVGNEVNADTSLVSYVVPTMLNLYASLQKYSLDSRIRISSPISLMALENSYPSSSGCFKKELVGTMIKPMLEFLRKTSSYLMVNIYPFFAYSANSNEISLNYALFKPNAGSIDPGNGLKYSNMFEAQLDAVYAAMAALKVNDVRVVVTETGWPSRGDSNEVGASVLNAAAYNWNLVKRVMSGRGTPLKPNYPLDVYLFALFNENQKPGPTSERNYGLFYPNQKKVYNMPLIAAKLARSTAKVGGKMTRSAAKRARVVVPSLMANSGGNVIVPKLGQTWCVANEKVSKEKLQAGLDWACGQGKADCRPIQPSGSCYEPNSLVAHASYAFSSYYQMNARAVGTCDFGGAAHVVTQCPNFGTCRFPTRY